MNIHSTCFSGLLRTVVIGGLLFLSASYTSNVNAAQGCGCGYHQSIYGGCIANYSGRYVVNPVLYYSSTNCWRNAFGYLRCY